MSDAEKPYVMSVAQTLQHCVQVGSAGEMLHNLSSLGLDKFPAAVSKDSGVGEMAEKHFTATTLVVQKDFAFTFNNVHELPRPKEVENVPVVLQVVTQEGNKETLFGRVKCDLVFYDGVRALHLLFQLFEWLDNKGDVSKLTPYLFSRSNVSDIAQQSRMGNYVAQMNKVLGNAAGTVFTSKWWNGEWQPGTFQSCMEDKLNSAGVKRGCRRFNAIPKHLNFKDVAGRMDAVKQLLKLGCYAITVNFPQETVGRASVALAIVPDLKCILNKEARLKHLTFPPAGDGPPPPMDAMHSALLFNCLFMNNYGRHTLNLQSKAQIIDIVWDWQGMYTTFLTFFWVIEVQGKLFARCCAPPDEWAKIEAACVLEPLGTGVAFQPVKFYKKGEQE